MVQSLEYLMPEVYLPEGIIQVNISFIILRMKHVDDFDSEEYLKKFGKRLTKLRSSKGYSQDRLCSEAGFARGTLSKIESGKVDPKLTTLARISETLDIPLKKILDLAIE